MANRKLPKPIQNIERNMSDVDRLLDIYRDIGGSGPGPRHKIEVLNRSAIVLAVACWEAYVEDLASDAFDFLYKNSSNPSTFPTKVLVTASKSLSDDPDRSAVWKLADKGWKKVLRDHKQEIIERSVGKLNTPKPENVKELFSKLIGLNDITASWRWKHCTVNTAASRLNALIDRRNGIAHRVTSGAKVRKMEVDDARDLILRLGEKCLNSVIEFLKRRTGRSPWKVIKYRGKKARK